jgi:hypothetical protein
MCTAPKPSLAASHRRFAGFFMCGLRVPRLNRLLPLLPAALPVFLCADYVRRTETDLRHLENRLKFHGAEFARILFKRIFCRRGGSDTAYG